MISDVPTGPAHADPNAMAGRLAQWSWMFAAACGVLTVTLGVAMVIWPEATISVIAVLIGLQFVLHGVYRIVQALFSDETGGERALYALLGALSLALGVLTLRHLLQTVAVLAMLVGLFWLVGGVIELVTLISRRSSKGSIALAVLSVLAGILVLSWPEITLVTLTWIMGCWLIVWGLITVLGAFWYRRMTRLTT